MTLEEVVSLSVPRRGWVTARLTGGPVLLPEEVASRLGVEPGASVDGRQVRLEARAFQTEDARKYTNRYLSLMERSSGQLGRKLSERGYLPDVVSDCLAWALEYGLVDDLRYARAFAACHTLGRAGLRARLRRDGVSQSAVSAALAESVESESVESLTELVKKKYGSLPDREKARRRAAGWLARRGFSSSVIAGVLERAF